MNWRGPLRHLEMTWNWSGPELDNYLIHRFLRWRRSIPEVEEKHYQRRFHSKISQEVEDVSLKISLQNSVKIMANMSEL